MQPLPEPNKIRPEKISGWLAVFLAFIVLGTLADLVFCVKNCISPVYSSFWYMLCYGSQGVCHVLLATCTVYAFFRRKPYAVFYGKGYMVVGFLWGLAYLPLCTTDDTVFKTSASSVVSFLVWRVIWFCYLTFSEQLHRMFPVQQRTHGWLNWSVLLLSMIPIVFLLIAVWGDCR